MTASTLHPTSIDKPNLLWAELSTDPAQKVLLRATASGELLTSASGAGASDIGKAEDAAHASGDVGVMSLAVRKATPANISSADGDYEPLQVSAGRVWASATVDAALPAGTNNIGDVDVLTLPALPTGTNNIGRVSPEPQTANGLSISRVISAADTNATSVKASAGQVYGFYASNVNAAVRYLKLYNKASAPTVGTDTPVMTLALTGGAVGNTVVLPTGGMGVAFGTGIALAITTGVADSDTGAVAANEIVVNLLYK